MKAKNLKKGTKFLGKNVRCKVDRKTSVRQNRDTLIYFARWLYRRGNIPLLPPVFLLKIVRCKVKGKQLRFQTTLQTIFSKPKGEPP